MRFLTDNKFKKPIPPLNIFNSLLNPNSVPIVFFLWFKKSLIFYFSVYNYWNVWIKITLRQKSDFLFTNGLSFFLCRSVLRTTILI